jgi:hypothetical protein
VNFVRHRKPSEAQRYDKIRPATLAAMQPRRRSPLGPAVSLVLLALLVLLAFLRGVLWASLQLSLGLLLACGGVGFVLAPVLRRRAGRATAADLHPLRRRSFQIGLAVTILGLALAGWALWRLVSHEVAAHALALLVSA